jgi:hypothetical protein
MTNRDVMIQILTEVSGKSKEYVTEVVSIVPYRKSFDSELPNDEANELLEKLRREKAGIMNWLIEGRRKMLADIRNIASHN